MRPPEEEVRQLVREWIAKADLDFETVVRLMAEERFRDIVAFHAQQSAEKYLKALLARYQIEFPKTHVIKRLLILLEPVNPTVVDTIEDANWLTPFGADIRYPGDRPDTMPGDEVRTHDLAKPVQDSVKAALGEYLSTS
jgi:HEPN domain-containing protein